MEAAPPSNEAILPPAGFVVMPGATTAPPRRTNSAPVNTDLNGWLALLDTCGAQSSRVTSPDLIAQLSRSQQSRIDTILCSALDTDPGVPFNATIAEAFATELAAALTLLGSLTGAPRIWMIADPDKSSAWFEPVRSGVKNPGLRLVPLRGDYPQTDPALMLYTLLQRRLPPGVLPTEKRALLLDVAAAVAIGRCVLHESSAHHTPLAVRDHFQKKTHLLMVPVGIRLGAVCEFLEINPADSVFRAGDFLRDQWITVDAALGSGELVIHATARQLDANPDPCIHCGWCLEACPTRIHPAGLLDAAQQKNRRAGKRFGMDACIECGICSYVCPTRLPLLSAIRGLKRL